MHRKGPRRSGIFFACLLALALALTGPSSAQERGPAPAELKGVAHTTTPDSIRVVLNLSGPVEISKNTLANPDRLFFDLKNARLNKTVAQVVPVKEGPVKGMRVGQYNATTVRVVFDLAVKEYDVRTNNRETPANLLIEVSVRRPAQEKPESKPAQKPETRPESSPAAKPEVKSEPKAEPKPEIKPEAAPEPKPEQKPETKPDQNAAPKPKPEASYFRKRIVIDAGHGGDDPGAVGPSGLYEKDVVLDIALRVKDILKREHRSYDILLTRDHDVFIPLPDRAAVANRLHADLFLSIHANASPRRQTRGIETYLLNYTNDAEAMRVAARENAISVKKMHEVQNDLGFILASLERESKRDESIKLAGYLQNSLASSICSRFPKVYNLGVKQALFYVLVDARMPSALVEVSFISNREEERLLSDAGYRQKIASAIASGIHEYFTTSSPLKVASGKASGSHPGKGLKPVKYAKR